MNLPDFRGVFPKGAGTTGRVAGKDASGNYYATTLGTYLTDKMQGHIWTGANIGVNAYRGSYLVSTGSGNSMPLIGGTGTEIQMKVAADDGTHGALRSGYTTEPQSLGINFIIKY